MANIWKTSTLAYIFFLFFSSFINHLSIYILCTSFKKSLIFWNWVGNFHKLKYIWCVRWFAYLSGSINLNLGLSSAVNFVECPLFDKYIYQGERDTGSLVFINCTVFPYLLSSCWLLSCLIFMVHLICQY